MTLGSISAGAQRADDAEEARVAGGQHGYGAGARVYGVEGLVEVLELFAFRAGRDRRIWVGLEVPGRADDELAAARACAGLRD